MMDPCRRAAQAAVCLWACLLAACGRPSTPRDPLPNVVLVTVDGLRADLLACYGNQGRNAPRIDAFAAEARVFEHAFAPASRSLPAAASLMTGLHPSSHGCVHADDVLGDGFVTLAERIYAEGVLTAAIQCDGALNMQSGVAQGFEHYDEEIASTNHEREGLSAAALFPLVTAKALNWLEEQVGADEPWFLWLHYASPWPGFTWLDPPQDPIGVASAADEAFGALLDRLAQGDLAEGTLVVLLGLHGEREVGPVPFLVRGLDLPAGRSAAPVSTVDLVPTLLELYQLDPAPVEGRSLVGGLLDLEPDRGPVLAHGGTVYGVAHEDRLYLVDRNALRARLYDLPGDPGRTVDLEARLPGEAAKLALLLAALRAGRFEWPPPAGPESESE